MIIETEDLGRHRRRVTMVDGGFDPLHPGHIAYFEAAAALGLPVLCNVSSDDYVARKHPPFLTQEERAAIIDAIRFVELTHLSQLETADVLRLLQPRSYAKGADWLGLLPEEEVAICTELGIDVVFLETVSHSSTAVLDRYTSSGANRKT